MTSPKRHLDKGLLSWQYAHSCLWVYCPKCNQKTEFKKSLCQKCHKTTWIVHCLCGFIFDTHVNNAYVGEIQKRQIYHQERCHHCGTKLTLKKVLPKNQSVIPKTLPITCFICQKVSNFTIHNHDVRQHYTHDVTLTSYGFSLYLQTPTRRGVIFAYNPEHLQELKAYILADLRERSNQAGNSSYFSRLPAWVKSAQHKKEVIKAIERLESKLRSAS